MEPLLQRHKLAIRDKGRRKTRVIYLPKHRNQSSIELLAQWVSNHNRFSAIVSMVTAIKFLWVAKTTTKETPWRKQTTLSPLISNSLKSLLLVWVSIKSKASLLTQISKRVAQWPLVTIRIKTAEPWMSSLAAKAIWLLDKTIVKEWLMLAFSQIDRQALSLRTLERVNQ